MMGIILWLFISVDVPERKFIKLSWLMLKCLSQIHRVLGKASRGFYIHDGRFTLTEWALEVVRH
jgi:hypothetical protein